MDTHGVEMKNRIVDGDWQLTREWLELIEDFADRFVIGTDEFIRLPGVSVGSPLAFKETWSILEQLPVEIRTKVGRDNTATVYGLD